jgi:hypothetical protein
MLPPQTSEAKSGDELWIWYTTVRLHTACERVPEKVFSFSI